MFRDSKFDAVMTAAQIVAVQSSFYLTYGLIVTAGALLTTNRLNLNILFSTDFEPWTFRGWAMVVAYLLSALAMCFWIPLVVQRAKLVLDFVCTLYAVHFVLASAIVEMPMHAMFYVALLSAILISAIGSEHVAMMREMMPIQTEWPLA